MTGPRAPTIILAILLCMVEGGYALSDDKYKPKRRQERTTEVEVQQDDILSALRRKEVRPMTESMVVAQRTIPGQIISVKAKRLDGVLVYEFKIIAVGGHIREVYVDALSLAVVKIE